MINFQNKKITVMGLGLLGRGIGVVKYLVGKGAKVTVTDLKDGRALKSSVKEIKQHYQKVKCPRSNPFGMLRGKRQSNVKIYPIKFVLGQHRSEDFRNVDMIFKAAGVPLDSPYVALARKNGAPIFMDDALFAREAQCQIIGVTGTRGKTTTATLIYELAKAAGKRVYPHTNKTEEINFLKDWVGEEKAGDKSRKNGIGVGAYLAGVRGTAALPFLDIVKKNDIVVLELSSWQLQGWRDLKISPRIAVVTNILRDHMNYYKNNMAAYIRDKAAIFENQTKNDYLVLNKNCPWCREFAKKARGKVMWFGASDVPRGWSLKILGKHNLENVAAAMAVGKLLGLPSSKIKKVVENFRGAPGRLEFVRRVSGVEFYNDTTATMPEATIAALKALAKKQISKKANKRIVLIAGGADKNLHFEDLAKEIKKYAKAVVLLNGTATPKLQKQLLITNYQLPITIVHGMPESVKIARKIATRGDVVLLSPAAASFGMFTPLEIQKKSLFIKDKRLTAYVLECEKKWGRKSLTGFKNEFDRGEQFLKEVKKIK